MTFGIARDKITIANTIIKIPVDSVMA